MIHGRPGSRSVDHGGQPCRLIFTERLQAFKLHVPPLQRPFVILFDHHSSNEPDDGAVIGEDTIERQFFASPAYLAEKGEPQGAEDLKHHSCLHYSLLSLSEEWAFAFGGSAETSDLHSPLSVNNAEVLRECAIQGMGITLLPRFAVEDALADGRLRQVLSAFSPEPLCLYAVRPSRQYTPARLRLFIAFLQESFAQH